MSNQRTVLISVVGATLTQTGPGGELWDMSEVVAMLNEKLIAACGDEFRVVTMAPIYYKDTALGSIALDFAVVLESKMSK